MLTDFSSNGTFVNKRLVGIGNLVELKDGYDIEFGFGKEIVAGHGFKFALKQRKFLTQSIDETITPWNESNLDIEVTNPKKAKVVNASRILRSTIRNQSFSKLSKHGLSFDNIQKTRRKQKK